MYDAQAALQAIDLYTVPILSCLAITVVFAFLYFVVAIRVALTQKVYVVPLIGAAVFFWHDLSFVLLYDTWFNVYDHWWVKLWWVALCGTVPLEAYMIWHVIRFGHQELWPSLPKSQYTALIIAATLGMGALWFVIKATIQDDLYFITFAVTAVWSVPFHTVLMARRQSRAGQSIFMEASTIVMLVSMSAAFAQAAPFFRSPIYLAFVATMVLWALANIWLITRFPPLETARASKVAPGRLLTA